MAIYNECLIFFAYVAPRLKLRHNALDHFAPAIAQIGREKEIVSRDKT
jgi:hypothetical protein